MRTKAAVFFICAFLPAAALAQAMADLLPDHTAAYMGWNGAEALGPGYEASHLKAVLDSSGVPAFVTDALPRLLARIPAEAGPATMALQAVTALGPSLWKHPTAVYYGGLELGQGGPPMPRFAVLIRAGADADALERQIETMLPPGAPVKCVNAQGVVAVIVGNDPDLEARLGKGAMPDSLANRADFKAELAGLGANPVIVEFVDMDAIVKQADDFSAQSVDTQQEWQKVRAALGLGAIHRIYTAAGFEGRDWSTSAFVARTPGSGVLPALLSPKPVSDAALRLAPRTATGVFAVHCDPSGLLELVRQVAGIGDPQAVAQLDATLQVLSQRLGVDVQKDLLDALGDEWVTYSDPTVTGGGMLSTVLINRPRDPAAVERSLEAIQQIAVSAAMAQAGAGGPRVMVRTASVGALTVHTLEVPLVGPSWTISGGTLYVALYPQVVAAAAGRDAAAPSILDNAEFSALRKRLGGEQAAAICFADLPKTMANAYQNPMALSQTITGAASMFGIEAPLMILPPLDKLLPQLEPAMTVVSSDDAGWHMRGSTPFPGAALLASPQSVGITAAPVLVSILLPALTRARQAADRGQSASHLSQIGKGCLLYANDHNGAYPPDLGSLVTEEGLTARTCVTPGRAVPPEVLAGDRTQQAAWVNEHSDYVYLGAGKNDTLPDTAVVAYERLRPGAHQGINILFGDGHVEFDAMPDVQRIFQEQHINPALR